eukprot:jgi/Botrbrau1/13903/Bobra.0017s0010.1
MKKSTEQLHCRNYSTSDSASSRVCEWPAPLICTYALQWLGIGSESKCMDARADACMQVFLSAAGLDCCSSTTEKQCWCRRVSSWSIIILEKRRMKVSRHLEELHM